ncbi:hypothetical protein HK096_001596 [Nowakowskiella sp. JEL0078]|nr:hypothetical protein HK096_001596 [Nowakowskiella sp. JEL0078]
MVSRITKYFGTATPNNEQEDNVEDTENEEGPPLIPVPAAVHDFEDWERNFFKRISKQLCCTKCKDKIVLNGRAKPNQDGLIKAKYRCSSNCMSGILPNFLKSPAHAEFLKEYKSMVNETRISLLQGGDRAAKRARSVIEVDDQVEIVESMSAELVNRIVPAFRELMGASAPPENLAVWEKFSQLVLSAVTDVCGERLTKLEDRMAKMEQQIKAIPAHMKATDEAREGREAMPVKLNKTWAAVVRHANLVKRTLPFTPAQAFAAATRANDAPRIPLEKATNIYVCMSSIPESKATIGQRIVYIREALKHINVTKGVLEVSFIGGSVVHLIVVSDIADEISAKLEDARILLKGFQPLADPPHRIISETIRTRNNTRLITRIAAVMNRARSHAVCQAAIDTIPQDMRDRVRGLLLAQCRWRDMKELVPEVPMQVEDNVLNA